MMKRETNTTIYALIKRTYSNPQNKKLSKEDICSKLFANGIEEKKPRWKQMTHASENDTLQEGV
jgi:hypothetical protein